MLPKRESPLSVGAGVGGTEKPRLGGLSVKQTYIPPTPKVKPVKVNRCWLCGYFRKIGQSVRYRCLCAWTGEKREPGSLVPNCLGYHPGRWEDLWAER